MEGKITVKIEFLEALALKVKDYGPLYELPEGVTVKEALMKNFGFKDNELKYLVISVNGTPALKDAELKNGDVLSVLMVIDGG